MFSLDKLLSEQGFIADHVHLFMTENLLSPSLIHPTENQGSEGFSLSRGYPIKWLVSEEKQLTVTIVAIERCRDPFSQWTDTNTTPGLTPLWSFTGNNLRQYIFFPPNFIKTLVLLCNSWSPLLVFLSRWWLFSVEKVWKFTHSEHTACVLHVGLCRRVNKECRCTIWDTAYQCSTTFHRFILLSHPFWSVTILTNSPELWWNDTEPITDYILDRLSVLTGPTQTVPHLNLWWIQSTS